MMDYFFEWEPVLRDSNAIQKHGINWAALGWLQANEVITGTPEVFSDNPSLVIDQVSHAAGLVSWRVTGGVHGENYVVTCRITTSDGRGDDRSLLYRVRER